MYFVRLPLTFFLGIITQNKDYLLRNCTFWRPIDCFFCNFLAKKKTVRKHWPNPPAAAAVVVVDIFPEISIARWNRVGKWMGIVRNVGKETTVKERKRASPVLISQMEEFSLLTRPFVE